MHAAWPRLSRIAHEITDRLRETGGERLKLALMLARARRQCEPEHDDGVMGEVDQRCLFAQLLL
jgi:hypothetical protein